MKRALVTWVTLVLAAGQHGARADAMDDGSTDMNPNSFIVTTTDNVRIACDLYQRQPGQETVLIICPGFFKSKETPTFQRMARALAVDRDVLCMDFRGHGRSGGLYTFSAREGADLEVVLAWARERYARIGILGFSLGGAIAINTLSSHRERVCSMMTVGAPCDFKDIEFKWWTPEAIRTGLQGLECGAGCRPGSIFLKKERPLDHIAALHPLPICFVHGDRDATVGVQHSRRLYAAACQPKRLEIIHGGGHAEALFRDDPQGFIRLVNSWFTDTMGGEAS